MYLLSNNERCGVGRDINDTHSLGEMSTITTYILYANINKILCGSMFRINVIIVIYIICVSIDNIFRLHDVQPP